MEHFLLIFNVLISVIICANCYVEKDGYVRIDLVRQKSPRQQMLEHHEQLEKYGYKIDWLHLNKRSAEPRTNDSINLFRYLDNEFYGQIVIGHPGQKMNVAFDTAWSLSWVLSLKCNKYSTPGCVNHNLYNHERSSYYKKNGTEYIGNEGTFNFTGFYSYENISIAHSNVTNYLFVEMVQVPDSMQFDKADGILGLGIKDTEYEPFIYTLYRQKKIKNLLFSIYLNRDRQSNRGGNIMLGFVDQKHIHKHQLKNKTVVPDTITYLPIDAGEYWKFSVDKINFVINPLNNVQTFCPTGCKAIADTSSNQIIGPKSDIDKLHDLMNAKEYKGKYTVDCDTVNKLPKLDIILAGTPFRLSGANYIMREKKDAYTLCVSVFAPSDGPTTDGIWVLGGAFLAQYYSIYDIVHKTIGFVRAA